MHGLRKGREDMAEYFLHSLLQTSIAMSLLALLLSVLFAGASRAVTAKAKYVMCIILLIGFSIPFRPMIGPRLITLETPLPLESVSVVSENSTNDATTQNSASVISAETTALPLGIIIFIIWGAGAVCVFGWHMFRYYKFRRTVNRWCKPVTDEGVLNLFQSTKERLSLGDKKIDLTTCDFVTSPMLTGIVHPFILLPDKPLDTDELKLVLEHELTHYKHKDLLVKLLEIIAASLHWFNPVIYMCCAATQIYSEACCDEAVLQGEDTDYRRFYGEIVIGLAESKSNLRTALSTCFYPGKFYIKRRLSVIMDTTKKWKKLSGAAIAVVTGLTLLSGAVVAYAAPANRTSASSTSLIDVEKAKSIALADADLSEKDVTFVKTKLDRDDGRYEYDIEFYSGNVEYDYEIDATTGKILEVDRDIEHYYIHGSAVANSMPATNNSFIGETKAKSIVLENAGLREADVTFIKVKLDYDDGRDVYDVEFYSANTEYDYEIDAITGQIREYDWGIESYTIPQTTPDISSGGTANTGCIGEVKAKSIALSHAGKTESDVRGMRVKLDYDDGMQVYEVEFYSGRTEYEYDIDAVTGNILEWDIDYD